MKKALFPLSTKQIVQIALFLAALLAVEFSTVVAAGATWLWFVFDWYYCVALIVIYVLCARVTGLRFAVLILGLCEALISLVFSSAYGGPVFVLYPFSEALALQGVFLVTRTNGENLKANILGGALFGLVGGIFFFIILGMWIMKQVFPPWYVGFRILSIVVTSTVGGYVAYRVGNKLKGVV
jgi:hypothetical protein